MNNGHNKQMHPNTYYFKEIITKKDILQVEVALYGLIRYCKAPESARWEKTRVRIKQEIQNMCQWLNNNQPNG